MESIRPVPPGSVSNPSASSRIQPATARPQLPDAEPAVQQSKNIPPASRALQPDSQVAEQGIPIPILRDEALTRAEWGWRKLLSELALSQLQADGKMLSDMNATAKVERSILQLWKIFAEVAQKSANEPWEAFVQVPPATDKIVPFAHLTLHKTGGGRGLDRVRTWILEDRLISSVQSANGPAMGGGLFFPELPQGESRSTAVRWRAERHTSADSQGKHMHRLSLTIHLDGAPVVLTFTASHPSVAVHAATNHERLRDWLSGGQEVLSPPLAQLGWHLERFVVSRLTDDELEVRGD